MTGERHIYMGEGNYIETINGNYIEGNYYEATKRQSPAAAAAEIQQLLRQLEKSYPTNTDAGREALANEAVERIKSNSTLMRRLFSAGKAGGVSALEAALNHPAASFVINALKDWQETGKT